ncbi:MAG: DUF3078 domain-containing protein [Crocinitomicaceae bacterium]|nr:DUF3078 domain-containing protein [Crocinitomicaceae bacterium]
MDGWKKGGLTALNISQVGLTNWAAGGQSSIALNGIVSLYANLKIGKSIWITLWIWVTEFCVRVQVWLYETACL